MDHLACFAAGMYGLAAHEEKDDNSERWMEIAKVACLKIFDANEHIWRYIFGLINHGLYLSGHLRIFDADRNIWPHK